jgi:hypothetical protein
MNNVQLYLAPGLPSALALVNIGVMLALFTHLSGEIRHLSGRVDNLIGAVNDLDKRLTKVEIKVGVQPQ